MTSSEMGTELNAQSSLLAGLDTPFHGMLLMFGCSSTGQRPKQFGIPSDRLATLETTITFSFLSTDTIIYMYYERAQFLTLLRWTILAFFSEFNYTVHRAPNEQEVSLSL